MIYLSVYISRNIKYCLCCVWWLLAGEMYALQPAQAPADSFRLQQSLAVAARFATTDNIGNIYVITITNTIEKYAPDGRLLTRYSNRRFGEASYLDVANPLKVLVWYADFRMVVFLDRSLTLLGALNLIEAGYPEVRTVAAAPDGRIWVYDEVNFRLVKITQEGEKLLESQPLSQVMATAPRIACIRDDNERVCASDVEQGLLYFDAYGQFQTLIPRKGVGLFQMNGAGFAWVDLPRLYHAPWRGPGRDPLLLEGTHPAWLSGHYLLRAGAAMLEVYTWQ